MKENSSNIEMHMELPQVMQTEPNSVNTEEQGGRMEMVIKLRCPYYDCPREFENTKSLYKHFGNFHDPHRNMKCCYCDHQSTCMSNFVAHVRKHTGEKPYQ